MVFVVFIVAVMTMSSTVFVHSEYTKEEYRDILCGKDDPETFTKLQVCFEMETEKAQRYAKGCMAESSPTKADTVPKFWEEVCSNKTIFYKFHECLMQFYDELTKEMSEDDEAARCDEALLEE